MKIRKKSTVLMGFVTVIVFINSTFIFIFVYQFTYFKVLFIKNTQMYKSIKTL